MKLYIANCSRQPHLFNYKLPERTQPFSQRIPAGQQVCLDLSKDEVSHIISQHQPYGFAQVNKLPRSFAGLCYSVDKQIDLDGIMHGAAEVKDTLKKRGEEVRKNSVATMDSKLTQAATAHGKNAADGLQVDIEGQPINPMDESPNFKETLITKE